MSEQKLLEGIFVSVKAKAEAAARIGDRMHDEAVTLEDSGALPADIARHQAEAAKIDGMSEDLANLSLSIGNLVGLVPAHLPE